MHSLYLNDWQWYIQWTSTTTEDEVTLPTMLLAIHRYFPASFSLVYLIVYVLWCFFWTTNPSLVHVMIGRGFPVAWHVRFSTWFSVATMRSLVLITIFGASGSIGCYINNLYLCFIGKIWIVLINLDIAKGKVLRPVMWPQHNWNIITANNRKTLSVQNKFSLLVLFQYKDCLCQFSCILAIFDDWITVENHSVKKCNRLTFIYWPLNSPLTISLVLLRISRWVPFSMIPYTASSSRPTLRLINVTLVVGARWLVIQFVLLTNSLATYGASWL